MAFVIRRLAPVLSLMRRVHTTPAVNELDFWDKISFNTCIYRKYGLLRDDLLRDSDPEIKEVLERIPEEMLMQRIYRSIRAQQLFLQHSVLPEDQWSKPEDDHYYLQPYIEEVEAEIAERNAWESTH